jgi:hypothetical protein
MESGVVGAMGAFKIVAMERNAHPAIKDLDRLLLV